MASPRGASPTGARRGARDRGGAASAGGSSPRGDAPPSPASSRGPLLGACCEIQRGVQCAPAPPTSSSGSGGSSAAAPGGELDELDELRRRRRRATCVLSLFLFVYSFGFCAVIGPFPELLLRRACNDRGLTGDACKKGESGTPHRTAYDSAQKSAAHSHLIFSVAQGGVGAFAVPALGALTEWRGRRCGLLVSAAANVAYGATIATVPARRQGDVLLACVAAVGVGGGMFSTLATSFAAMADVTRGLPTAERARSFGTVEGFLWAGLLVGPLTMGAVVDAVGLEHVFWLCAGCNAAAFLLALFAFDETLERDRRVRPVLRRVTPLGAVLMLRENRQAATMCVAMGLTLIASGAKMYAGVFYAKKQAGWNATQVGIWQSLEHGSGSAGLLLILPAAMRHMPLNRVALVSLVSTTVTTTLYGLSTSGWMLYALGGARLVESLLYPVVRSAVTNIFGKHRYGECLAMVGLMQQLAALLAPLYQILYAATEDYTYGPVHGVTFIIAGFIGLAGVGCGLLVGHIDPVGDAPLLDAPAGGGDKGDGDDDDGGCSVYTEATSFHIMC